MESGFCGKHCNSFVLRLITTSVLLLMPLSFANAAGDAAQGQHDYDYTCKHCHGSPQPGKPGAFSDFDVSANRLSVYANDPSALTKAANEGYVIPEGNSNNDYPPGAKTTEAMNSFAGTGPKRLGEGTTPTTYAINLSAYFASLFSVPNSPTIGAVTVGNGEASVSFTVPKSDLTITGYTVTANPGEITATGLASPISVKGLTNGTAYTFTVTASSNAGSSKPSSASNSVTPVAASVPVAQAVKAVPIVVAVTPVVPVPVATVKSAVPSAPVAQAKVATPAGTVIASANASAPKAAPASSSVAAAAPVTQAKVVIPAASVTPPVPQVKSAIPVVPLPVAKAIPAAPTVPITPVVQAKIVAPVSSVAPASATAKPKPVTAVASAPAPAPSAVVAAGNNVAKVQAAGPSHPTAQKIVLQTPTMKMARAGSMQARVFFGAPADSASITGYTVTALSGGAATGITATGTKSPITISGLTNGTQYTFTVTANSSAGVSEASEQSNAVTPLKILGD
jgi:hypothetical protein